MQHGPTWFSNGLMWEVGDYGSELRVLDDDHCGNCRGGQQKSTEGKCLEMRWIDPEARGYRKNCSRSVCGYLVDTDCYEEGS